MDFQSVKSFGKLRLRAFQPNTFYVGGVESSSKELRAVMLMHVEGVERTYTHFTHNFLNI